MTSEKFLTGVILVSFEYPPRRLSPISDVVFQVANFCLKKGVDVWVVTFDDWRSEITNENGIVVNRIPNHVPNNISDLTTILNLKCAYQAAIAAIMHEHQVDILHLFEWQTLPLLVPWGGNIQPKIIYTTTSIQMSRENARSPYNQGLKKIEEQALTNTDLILVDTDQLMLNAIKAYNLEPKKVVTQKIRQRKIASKIFQQYLTLFPPESKEEN
ncbi:MAG: glycosyltransferase family 4 protein [Candidatus Heimdallarchaeota archaeon]|nr:glycosyltransferase family 4 protein [Candidatus Heimdallarchaeota archaeon]